MHQIRGLTSRFHELTNKKHPLFECMSAQTKNAESTHIYFFLFSGETVEEDRWCNPPGGHESRNENLYVKRSDGPV